MKGCPRPFGWQDDRVTLEPGEADAIRWAADTLLVGGTVSGITREWNRRGLLTAQGGKPFTRNSVAVIMRNPRLAGLSTYKKEIVGTGEWEQVLSEQQWRAVEALLGDPARKPPRGAYSLLGGLADCQCGTTVIASVNHRTTHVYRCDPQKRGDRPGPHCQQRRELVDEYVEALILERLSRDDIAELIAVPPSGPDPAELRREAASIRANLDEMAADRALGLVTRAQMLKATQTGNDRLDQIAAQLAELASESVLAPFAHTDDVQGTWDAMDRSRKRAVISALVRVVILPAGRGARDFNPETIRLVPRVPHASA